MTVAGNLASATPPVIRLRDRFRGDRGGALGAAILVVGLATALAFPTPSGDLSPTCVAHGAARHCNVKATKIAPRPAATPSASSAGRQAVAAKDPNSASLLDRAAEAFSDILGLFGWGVDPLKSHAPTAASDPEFFNIDVSKLPMGMQNGNPGNIKFVAGVNWTGQLGPSMNTDQGDAQIVFDNSADGMVAAADLILKKFAWGHDTVRKIIVTPRVGWTPGYLAGAKGVAEASGLGLDAKLNLKDPAILAKLLRGIVVQEHGISGLIYSDDFIEEAAEEALSHLAAVEQPVTAVAQRLSAR